MDAASKRIGIIILAAGASRRMHAAKQLLLFQGKSLLRRAVETALETNYRPVIIVLGANFESTRAEIEDLPVEIVFNEDWQTGLSSSLKVGLEKLIKISPEISAAVVALADQPYVTSQQLNLFGERFNESRNLVIAARYGETTGVPALFARELFGDFDELEGDKGAKPIIEKHRASLLAIDLPDAAFDVDTPEDYAALKRD